MATLYIEEYGVITFDRKGNPLNLPDDLEKLQKLAIASAANTSTATTQMTSFVALTADTACQFEIGTSPVAGANSRYLPADVPRYLHISSGDKISVVQQK